MEPSENKPNKDELKESLSNVIEYITENVANKVNNFEGQQNGFESVNKAAETMASSGGTKPKKTRKFRLTKNKTRQNK